MNRSLPVRAPAALALAALVAAGIPRAAEAQSKADAFAGKIPPVSAQLFRKEGRIEVNAGGALSLNDAFYTKYFGGIEAAYHLTESWALSLGVAGGFTGRSGSAVVCSASSGCGAAEQWRLWQVPGRIRGLAAAGVAWSPVYGKLNVLAEQVAHFDLALLAGADLIERDDILSSADAQRLDAEGGSPGLKTSPGFHVGLGAHLFLTEFVALRFQIKDVVYYVKVPNNGPANDWQNQLFTEIGVSFFFPSQNRPQR